MVEGGQPRRAPPTTAALPLFAASTTAAATTTTSPCLLHHLLPLLLLFLPPGVATLCCRCFRQVLQRLLFAVRCWRLSCLCFLRHAMHSPPCLSSARAAISCAFSITCLILHSASTASSHHITCCTLFSLHLLLPPLAVQRYITSYKGVTLC